MEPFLVKVKLSDETNKAKVVRFVSGLRRNIQDLVESYKYSSIEDVLHFAIKIESQLKRNEGARKSYSNND